MLWRVNNIPILQEKKEEREQERREEKKEGMTNQGLRLYSPLIHYCAHKGEAPSILLSTTQHKHCSLNLVTWVLYLKLSRPIPFVIANIEDDELKHKCGV